MAFEDLREFHDPDLVLPINGKEYRIKSPSAADGLRIRQLFSMEAISDQSELAEIMKLLGAEWKPDVQQIPVLNPMTGEPVFDDEGVATTQEADLGAWAGGLYSEMDGDGISWDEIVHAGRTALINTGLGRVIAETHWRIGLTPDVSGVDSGNPLPAEPEPNRAARRATEKPKKATSSKAATGSTTRGRARTAKTTQAAPTTTRRRASGTATGK